MNLSGIKRIIGIAIGALVLGALGFFVYTNLSPSAPIAPTGQQGISGGVAPGTNNKPIITLPPGEIPALSTSTPVVVPANPAQRLNRITDFPVIAPSLNKAGDKILFYKKDGGDLFSADFDGKNLTKISNITIVGPMDAVWSPIRDRAAVSYLDPHTSGGGGAGGDTVKSFLHIGTSSVAVLPTDLTSITWSPDGKSLAYTKQNGTALELVISDAGAKNAKTIFRTPVLDARILWISADAIIFATPASGVAEGYVFSYARSTGAFEKIFGPLFGLEVLFSPYESRMVASYTSRGGGQPALRVLNPFDPQRKDLFDPGFVTLAEKCVFGAKQELWCAAPRSLAGASSLPDQYLTGEFNSSDRIVNIDLAKHEVTEVFSEQNFDITNLILAKDKSYLFFVSRRDGTLWSVKLK